MSKERVLVLGGNLMCIILYIFFSLLSPIQGLTNHVPQAGRFIGVVR